MKKRIPINYNKIWVLLSILCLLLIVASAGAAELPARPDVAAPVGETLAAGELVEMVTADSMMELTATTISGNTFLDGADRLSALQNDDGGWDWPLDDGIPSNASPLNTIGPIAQGLAIAYLHTGDEAHLTALENAGALLLTKTNNFSPSDGYLAAQLDAIFGGTTYVDHVLANYYNPLAAGTYDKNGAGTLYDTASYVSLIDTSRANSGIPNLAAWDIAIGLVGAASVGADTTAWINGVEKEINELDGSDSYDVIGLAGAVYGLAFVGEDFDPTAGEHTAAGSLADLAAILASYQIDGGGFAWNSAYVIPDDSNETIQETAYAVLALNEVSPVLYKDAISGAVNYIGTVQLATGGWENYGGSGENNEITGEALWATGAALSVIPEIADPVVCDEATVDISINNVTDLYGYEFKVIYDEDLVSASGKFKYTWFDHGRTPSSDWDANCMDGVCKFALTRVSPDEPVNESGIVASITFTSVHSPNPDSFAVAVEDILLTDRDGFPITPVTPGSVNVDVCGTATVSGLISLQGRLQPNGDNLSVVMNGPYGSYTADPVNQSTGAYTISGVQYLVNGTTGTDYQIIADHYLYLKNALDPLNVVGDIAGLNTKLLGGDANNNGAVGIADLTCIGTDFGTTNTNACDPDPLIEDNKNSTDINADAVVNIQDLAIAGGNFDLHELLGW
ncbi:MAG: hypothetical protein ACK2U1_23750 [Anaerolineales bacterium]